MYRGWQPLGLQVAYLSPIAEWAQEVQPVDGLILSTELVARAAASPPRRHAVDRSQFIKAACEAGEGGASPGEGCEKPVAHRDFCQSRSVCATGACTDLEKEWAELIEQSVRHLDPPGEVPLVFPPPEILGGELSRRRCGKCAGTAGLVAEPIKAWPLKAKVVMARLFQIDQAVWPALKTRAIAVLRFPNVPFGSFVPTFGQSPCLPSCNMSSSYH